MILLLIHLKLIVVLLFIQRLSSISCYCSNGLGGIPLAIIEVLAVSPGLVWLVSSVTDTPAPP